MLTEYGEEQEQIDREVVLPAWVHCPRINEGKRCGGNLWQTESDIVCERCHQLYRHHGRVPLLIPGLADDAKCDERHPQDHYDYDAIIQTYYETQYGPFIHQPESAPARLPLPQPHGKMRTVARSQPLLRAARKLLSSTQLTESFYQTILALCVPHILPNAQILDVGCGLGRITGELARHTTGLVYGIDRSPRMVREARRIVMDSGPHQIALNTSSRTSVPAWLDLDWRRQNVGFAVADALALPIADNSMDMVVCLNVLDRVFNPAQMIAEFHRVLRPRGKLLITDPYHWDEQYTPLDNWVENMTDLFLSSQWRILNEVEGVPFILRYEPRRVTLYQNHCLLYAKRVSKGAKRNAS